MVKPKEKILFHNMIPVATAAIVATVVGLLLLTNASAVFAFTNPDPALAPGTYPTTAIPNLKFLNGSSVAQQKLGSLVVGSTGGTSKLCLNSAISAGNNEATNCISSWNDAAVTSNISGTLGIGSLATGAGRNFADYVRQVGFVRLKNDNDPLGINKNQRYSLIAEANTNSSLVTGAAAILASEGPLGTVPYTSNWAGYFSGKVSLFDGNWDSQKMLCLNDTNIVGAGSQKGCIRRWVDFAFGTSGQLYLPLLASSGSGAVSNGRVATTGSLVSASVTTGNIAGMPLGWTCGDGICSANTNPAETSSSCSIDCSNGPAAASVQMYSGDGKVYIVGTMPPVTPNSPTSTLLILRRVSSSGVLIQPISGTIYSVGDLLGGAGSTNEQSKVIVSQMNMTPNQAFQFTDTSLTNNRSYIYDVFTADTYPKYGSANNPFTITPNPPNTELTINFSGITAAGATVTSTVVHGEGPTSNCGSPTSCLIEYTDGALVSITRSVPTGYTFIGWFGDCTGTGSCLVTMNGGQSVSAYYKKSSGSGGGGGGGQHD